MPGREYLKSTCPRDCYDACGISVVREGGRIVKVLGDPDHPVSRGALCSKCAIAFNGVWLDPARRLATPLRRSGPKGAGRFVPVSWAQALEEIAGRLNPIIEAHGGESILNTHYTGTVSLLAGNLPLRFFNRIGATEVDPDTVCNKAGHEALNLIFGSSFKGFDPRTSDAADCLLIWGANPSVSAPHIHKHWLAEARRRGSRIVVIDPIAHDSAQKADLHLQPFPGSDGALAFGLLHLLREQGKFDRAFIGDRVAGWEEVERQLDPCTPEWTAGRTGVAPAALRQAAEWYGRGRSLLWLGQGLQRQRLAGNTFRACTLLPIATGNLGRAGSGVYYMNAFPARGVEMDELCGTALRRGPAPFLSHMDLAARLEDPARSRALFTWNNNIAASNPEQTRLRRALAREDLLHIALDCFHTDTTAFADYLLPAASFLEFDDLVVSYFHYSLSIQAKAAEPPGGALPNQEIFRRLARAMGLSDAALFEEDEGVMERLLHQMGYAGGIAGLRSRGTVDWRPQPVIPFADHRFDTPDGRVRVAGAAFEAAGLPVAPLPSAEERPEAHRFRLLSPASEHLMNSSYANDARIARRQGPQTLWLHPADLARLGVAPGARVRLQNATGSLELPVGASDRLLPGVALLPKGRWPSLEAAGANVNVLNPGERTDFAHSACPHSMSVEVVPLPSPG